MKTHHANPKTNLLQKGTASTWTRLGLALLVATVLAALKPIAVAQPSAANLNPGIVPPWAKAYGKTYGEWAAAWWQWGLSIPAERNPLTDPSGDFCDEGQSGPVWFRGALASSNDRVCRVPAGKALFMPIYNWLFGAGVYDCDPTVPGVPCDVATLRAAAAAETDKALVLEVLIDGVPVQNVRDYRASSPEPFSLTYPANGIVPGVPAGTYYPQVTDGYWLLLAPLSKGTHTIWMHVLAPGTSFGTIEFTSLTHIIVE